MAKHVLGVRQLPKELSGFELQAFFIFSNAEVDLIHALYTREAPLVEHQCIAWHVLEFTWMSEHQRRAWPGLPELILAVDAQVRFSWLMLGREPRSTEELLMVYAGIMAHGTSLSAAECARMMPQLSAAGIRQAMRSAANERRLAQASQAVHALMQRRPIAESWGRADLASADMMSMETTKRVWQARMDPRRNTASVGIYPHVRDRWGVFHAQPFVLNERQAGVAIEGVVRNEHILTRQLAVDTHGYSDFAMTLARVVGFDLCPRLKELKQRHLYLPRGMKAPEEIAAVCRAHIDT